MNRISERNKQRSFPNGGIPDRVYHMLPPNLTAGAGCQEGPMKWSAEAEAAVKKVPFFVRKRVRGRVEKEAADAGKTVVTLAEVKATQKRYLTNMASEIKGYQLDTCFGPGGCPNRANPADGLLEKIEDLLKRENFLGFLKQQVGEDLKFHHEFRVTVADCPNACSQPQIKDIGIIGASVPVLTDEDCSRCSACLEACKEAAVSLSEAADAPTIDADRCINCGQCIRVCPTGTIAEGKRGFRIQLGGKLGRHPRLARELPGIYSEKALLEIIKACVDFYKSNSRKGRRFADIFNDTLYNRLIDRFGE